MAAAAKKPAKNGVLIIRSRSTVALPIGQLGYNHLIEPDEAFGAKKFDACIHLNPKGIEALVAMVQKNAVDAHLEELTKEAGGSLPCAPQSAEDWVAARLKEAKEGFWTSLPFLQVSAKFRMLKRRDGTEYPLSMKAWDAKNNLLDLAALKMAKGSMVELICYTNLVYASAKKIEGVDIPASVKPNLQLAGVRIHKLERYGASGPATADDDAIREILGDDYAADDLAAFAHMEKKDPEGGEGPDTPEGEVKEMF
jgi:hypothetical protein